MVTAERSRGQLLLIGALVIATVIVASVVLLNSVHSSPDIAAETDARSLDQVDTANSEIRNDLEHLFRATNSVDGERLAYVEPDSFESVVEEYADSYNDLIGVESASVANVTYVASEAVDGAIAWNTSVNTTQPEEKQVLWDVDADSERPVPQFTLEATNVTGEVTIEFNDTGSLNPESELRIDGGEVVFNDGTVDPLCELGQNASIDLRAGTGEIVTDEEFCVVDIAPWTDSDEISLTHDGGVETLSYEISGDNASCGEGEECLDDSIDLNPRFHISVQDPSVSYSSTFRLYEVSDG